MLRDSKGRELASQIMLSRNTESLDDSYDLVVVGGGIFGAFAAWDAALRGLRVALIERDDFGSGASANCYKIAHGGIRYMQHFDISRVRSSSHERSALLRLAPHMVKPLPIVVPTYGHGRSGKLFLRLGTAAYDALTWDRNRGIPDTDRHIPAARSLSRQEALAEFPQLVTDNLTGGVLFCDGQLYNPPRLVFEVVAEAVAAGATALNKVKATRISRHGSNLSIDAVDTLNDQRLAIEARAVLNAAGPWAENLLADSGPDARIEPGVYSRDLCFVIDRKPTTAYSLALQTEAKDPDAILGRAARHLFMVPWRGKTLIGVWHKVYKDGPDGLAIDESEKLAFLDEVNRAYPGIDVSADEITMWNTGLVPFESEQVSDTNLRYGKRSRFVDHRSGGGIPGLFTLIGIRYTMGRGDAARAVDAVLEYLKPGNVSACQTDKRVLSGGGFRTFESLLGAIGNKLPELPEASRETVAHTFGANYERVFAGANREDLGPVSGTAFPRAGVRYVAKHEMCNSLLDIVFRRTDIGTAGHPGTGALVECSQLAAEELGWTKARRLAELEATERRFPFGFRHARPEVVAEEPDAVSAGGANHG